MTRISAIQKIVGLLLALFSATMLPPIAVSRIYGDESAAPFVVAFLLILGAGLALWVPVRKVRRELRLRDGFLVVVMFWVALGASGSVPLLLADHPELALVDAVFESVSGTHHHRGHGDRRHRRDCRLRSSSIASNCNGWAAWASSCSRSPFCRCWG